jgi:hypothetical protein
MKIRLSDYEEGVADGLTEALNKETNQILCGLNGKVN